MTASGRRESDQCERRNTGHGGGSAQARVPRRFGANSSSARKGKVPSRSLVRGAVLASSRRMSRFSRHGPLVHRDSRARWQRAWPCAGPPTGQRKCCLLHTRRSRPCSPDEGTLPLSDPARGGTPRGSSGIPSICASEFRSSWRRPVALERITGGRIARAGFHPTSCAYAYLMYATMMAFNVLFPVYVAIFALSLSALCADLAGLDHERVKAAVTPRFPRRFFAGFLLGD